MKKLLIGIIGSSLVLTGCLGGGNEKQAFIDATVEATCLIFQAEDIFDQELTAQAEEIYVKYGFDPEDEAAMEELTKKYGDNEEVREAVTTAVASCSGEALKGLEEALGAEASE